MSEERSTGEPVEGQHPVSPEPDAMVADGFTAGAVGAVAPTPPGGYAAPGGYGAPAGFPGPGGVPGYPMAPASPQGPFPGLQPGVGVQQPFGAAQGYQQAPTGYPVVQGYPGGGYPYPGAPTVAVLPDGQVVPAGRRIDRVEGTPFGVAYPRVVPTPDGPAIGSLIAGIASVLVSFAVSCTGIAAGGGALVGGAFALLSTLAALGAIVLGALGQRRIKRAAGQSSGRGMAIAGLICAGVGLLIATVSMVAAVLN